MFSSVGSLYELRMMIGFSGANRGYCYVRYSTLAEADEAQVPLISHPVTCQVIVRILAEAQQLPNQASGVAECDQECG